MERSYSTMWSRVKLPPGPKHARLTQPICTGPLQVGFVFDPLRQFAWNRRLAELRRFKEANGGKLDVPRNDPLGEWCSFQARPPPPHDA